MGYFWIERDIRTCVVVVFVVVGFVFVTMNDIANAIFENWVGIKTYSIALTLLYVVGYRIS